MKPWVLRIVFALALLSIGYMWGHRSAAVVHAQEPTQVSIPKAYGSLIGMTTGVFVFQDRTGTIRLVAADTGVVGELVTRN